MSGDMASNAGGTEDEFESISRLVRLARDGDAAAADELLRLLQATLRAIAHRQRRRMIAGETLRTTALINEALLKVLRCSRKHWRDRDHFVALPATAMRQVLDDHARRRKNRPPTAPQISPEFDALVDQFQSRSGDLAQLDEALRQLALIDSEAVRVVDIRFIGGYPMDEIARMLGKPLRTLERDRQTARAWLHRRLS